MNKFFRGLGILSIGCGSQTNLDPAGPEDDEDISHDWERDEDGGCPESWLLTYSLDGRIDVTDTPLNLGNADALVGGLETDEIVLRVSNDEGVPTAGQVLVTSFNLLQDFTVSVNVMGDFTIVTDLLSTASDECGVASGQFEDSIMTWDECGFGPEYGTPNWTPDEGAYGAGCINDYHVEGSVDCVDESLVASCSDAWFDDGANAMDYVYNQPMLSFEFDSNDLEYFTMQGSAYGTELPTFSNNRTWLSLQGSLKSMSLEPTPDCLCSE